MLGRGLVRRCARCGSGGLFRRWVSMVDHCPRCGHGYERSDGFWLGSIMLNNAATFGAVLVVFAGTMIVTWPDVPWNWLLVGVMATAVVVPIVFHPISRTLWVAMEMAVRPLSDDEAGAATARRLLNDETRAVEARDPS